MGLKLRVILESWRSSTRLSRSFNSRNRNISNRSRSRNKRNRNTNSHISRSRTAWIGRRRNLIRRTLRSSTGRSGRWAPGLPTLSGYVHGRVDDNVRTNQRGEKPELDNQNCEKCCTGVIDQRTKHDSHDRRYGGNGERLCYKKNLRSRLPFSKNENHSSKYHCLTDRTSP